MASELSPFGWTPGNYWFVCRDCRKKQCVGSKRSWRCEDCAKVAAAKWNEPDTRSAPAATDTGLETVAYGNFREPDGALVGLCEEGNPNWTGSKPLCDLSQAEELLAAERANTETALEQRNMTIAELARLEADNAAQAARIKELEAALDSDPSGSDLWRYWSRKACEASQKYVDEVDRAEALEAKLAAAEKALETKSAANEALSKSVVESIDTEKRLREALELIADIDTRPYRCASIARAVLGGKPS